MREMLRPLTGRTSDLSPSNLLDGGGPTLGSPVRLMVTEFLMLTFSYLSTKYCSRSSARPKARAASGSTNLIKVCRKVIGLKLNSSPYWPRLQFPAAPPPMPPPPPPPASPAPPPPPPPPPSDRT